MRLALLVQGAVIELMVVKKSPPICMLENLTTLQLTQFTLEIAFIHKCMIGTIYTWSTCIPFNTSCCKIGIEILGYLMVKIYSKQVSLLDITSKGGL